MKSRVEKIDIDGLGEVYLSPISLGYMQFLEATGGNNHDILRFVKSGSELSEKEIQNLNKENLDKVVEKIKDLSFKPQKAVESNQKSKTINEIICILVQNGHSNCLSYDFDFAKVAIEQIAKKNNNKIAYMAMAQKIAMMESKEFQKEIDKRLEM